ncbi:Haloalkane dehalogenase [Pigmentiphaga humi]|uniref:Haloalkane dehalogenase n=1 Tax=Pigmentiphaga humi TaxID=2478468 RepID=A0A3P4B8D1_9BURK|nr:alpha/beta hydrolase [Pigmentiphaga humi]VCU72577.1 Haloalkane dehalogenase [Pigmentiphaga humi]
MYEPLAPSRSEYLQIRGLRHHFRCWGERDAPLLLALHGWMDSSASFQFIADRLAGRYRIVAPDWRGFGKTAWSGGDSYEVGEYLGDLDAFCRHFSPSSPLLLLGHSMGGNMSMLYAGVRPERVAAVVNLEGLGLPAVAAQAVPARLRQWLDQIAAGARLGDYDDAAAYAQRMLRDNPRLDPDRALFLASENGHEAGGRWRLRADPAHKIVNRVAYRIEEVLACWRAIAAPVLWVEAAESAQRARMHALPDYAGRLACVASMQRAEVADAGHMLHQERPAEVADLVSGFLERFAPVPAAGPTMGAWTPP